MFRRIIYLIAVTVIGAAMFLIAFSPDVFSMAFAGLMLIVVSAGLLFGILPMIAMGNGFWRGTEKVHERMAVDDETGWSFIARTESLFRQRILDRLYAAYREKIEEQHETGQLLSDIEDDINEDVLSVYCWNNAVNQIPGTLTGLGILGTFMGLVIGISEVGFSSVEAALISVQELLTGIRVAFYTSIAGVILSIMFNIIHKMVWSYMTRQMQMFINEFHKNVIPAIEEQERFRQRVDMKMVLDRLDRIPKRPEYSIASGIGNRDSYQKNEKVLLPQIIEGIRKGEFFFVLQGRYDLNSRTLTGAEAFVRWSHEKLGTINPSVFLPILEENGYITKLDEYTWENVCKQIKAWMDKGLKIVPVSVNISKTDILAGDIVSFFSETVKKYQIPPRMLELEIARNAFYEAGEITCAAAKELRSKGFKVILDDYDGDLVQVNELDASALDELKLDLRAAEGREAAPFIKTVYEQSRRLPFKIAAGCIETMDQISALRKAGCETGQGYYFERPMSVEDFERKLESED